MNNCRQSQNEFKHSFDQADFDASKSGTQRDLVFGLDKNLEPHL